MIRQRIVDSGYLRAVHHGFNSDQPDHDSPRFMAGWSADALDRLVQAVKRLVTGRWGKAWGTHGKVRNLGMAAIVLHGLAVLLLDRELVFMLNRALAACCHAARATQASSCARDKAGMPACLACLATRRAFI